MHEQHQQHLQHSSSTSHLSPANYPAHHMQSHSPDAQAPQDGDGGYPSPSSASTISAGSNHSHQQHTIPHDNSPNPHTAVGNGNGNRVGQGHARTNTSSELAFALQDAQAKDDIGPLQYPEYPSGNSDHNIAHEQGYQQYPQEQAHHAHPEYQKAQAQGHFPTVYEGYVYPPPGNENEAYAAGAIELSHMCVPASEGVHFMGGYMQYP
ncbi:hypothetical protein BD311DRAFT_756285 [Dichomitus squalens]|uniref:Uncharacterized protein n=1 Tax=Dichomitus squalens TaxID=114155 RepID=A0A4V2K0M7_9APHY|nr:hypothetical protein BD311DRAFT_756285 [Dichomitus squalens]